MPKIFDMSRHTMFGPTGVINNRAIKIDGVNPVGPTLNELKEGDIINYISTSGATRTGILAEDMAEGKMEATVLNSLNTIITVPRERLIGAPPADNANRIEQVRAAKEKMEQIALDTAKKRAKKEGAKK